MSVYGQINNYTNLETAGTPLGGAHLDAEFAAIAAALNGITQDQIASGAIGSAQLAALCALTANLALHSVTYQKLAAGSVNSDKATVYRSADTSVTNATTQSFFHGLADENGAARTPQVVIVYALKSVGGQNRYVVDSNLAFTWDNSSIVVYNANGSPTTVSVIAW